MRFLLLAALTLHGCADPRPSLYGDARAPLAVDAPVEVFYQVQPTREFDKVGFSTISINAGDNKALRRVVENVKPQARAIGADGVILTAETSPGRTPKQIMTAQFVRFR